MDICSNYMSTPFPPITGEKNAPYLSCKKYQGDGSIQHGFITDKMNDAEVILDGMF